MNNLIEINIKSLNQTVSLALGEFLVELDRAKFAGVKVIKVVTGYGSHGKGGEIKRELNKLLNKLKRENKITNYFKGETISREDLTNLNKLCPELILDNEILSYNSGVVLVVV